MGWITEDGDEFWVDDPVEAQQVYQPAQLAVPTAYQPTAQAQQIQQVDPMDAAAQQMGYYSYQDALDSGESDFTIQQAAGMLDQSQIDAYRYGSPAPAPMYGAEQALDYQKGIGAGDYGSAAGWLGYGSMREAEDALGMDPEQVLQYAQNNLWEQQHPEEAAKINAQTQAEAKSQAATQAASSTQAAPSSQAAAPEWSPTGTLLNIGDRAQSANDFMDVGQLKYNLGKSGTKGITQSGTVQEAFGAGDNYEWGDVPVYSSKDLPGVTLRAQTDAQGNIIGYTGDLGTVAGSGNGARVALDANGQLKNISQYEKNSGGFFSGLSDILGNVWDLAKDVAPMAAIIAAPYLAPELFGGELLGEAALGEAGFTAGSGLAADEAAIQAGLMGAEGAGTGAALDLSGSALGDLGSDWATGALGDTGASSATALDTSGNVLGDLGSDWSTGTLGETGAQSATTALDTSGNALGDLGSDWSTGFENQTFPTEYSAFPEEPQTFPVEQPSVQGPFENALGDTGSDWATQNASTDNWTIQDLNNAANYQDTNALDNLINEQNAQYTNVTYSPADEAALDDLISQQEGVYAGTGEAATGNLAPIEDKSTIFNGMSDATVGSGLKTLGSGLIDAAIANPLTAAGILTGVAAIAGSGNQDTPASAPAKVYNYGAAPTINATGLNMGNYTSANIYGTPAAAAPAPVAQPAPAQAAPVFNQVAVTNPLLSGTGGGGTWGIASLAQGVPSSYSLGSGRTF